MDNYGEVVWWCAAPQSNDIDVKQLANGDLFFPQGTPGNSFVELNVLGKRSEPGTRRPVMWLISTTASQLPMGPYYF